jgi:hypothetical protein
VLIAKQLITKQLFLGPPHVIVGALSGGVPLLKHSEPVSLLPLNFDIHFPVLVQGTVKAAFEGLVAGLPARRVARKAVMGTHQLRLFAQRG